MKVWLAVGYSCDCTVIGVGTTRELAVADLGTEMDKHTLPENEQWDVVIKDREIK